MSNHSPDVAGLFKILSERDLQISAMTFDKGAGEAPLNARIVFRDSVDHIPPGLPKRVTSLGREVPVTYQKFERH